MWIQYLQVAADLWAHLDLHAEKQDGSPGCNAYAASTCVLGLLTLESFALAWLDIQQVDETTARRFDFERDVHSMNGWLMTEDDLHDLILLRNALIHAHLVQSDLDPDPENTREVQSQKLRPLSGDGKARNILDGPERRSLHLNLHLDPSMVDRSDCRAVFRALDLTVQGNLASNAPLPGLKTANLYPSRKNEPVIAVEWLQQFRGPVGEQ